MDRQSEVMFETLMPEAYEVQLNCLVTYHMHVFKYIMLLLHDFELIVFSDFFLAM